MLEELNVAEDIEIEETVSIVTDDRRKTEEDRGQKTTVKEEIKVLERLAEDN